jgi:PilZ domain-containing protein
MESSEIEEGDRRAWMRHRISLPMTLKTIELGGDSRWLAHSQDVSAGGFGVVLERRFEPLTMVAATLQKPDDGEITMLARVVRAMPMPDGEWFLGCELPFPLDAEELTLLGSESPLPKSAEPVANGIKLTLQMLRERLQERLKWKMRGK